MSSQPTSVNHPQYDYNSAYQAQTQNKPLSTSDPQKNGNRSNFQVPIIIVQEAKDSAESTPISSVDNRKEQGQPQPNTARPQQDQNVQGNNNYTGQKIEETKVIAQKNVENPQQPQQGKSADQGINKQYSQYAETKAPTNMGQPMQMANQAGPQKETQVQAQVNIEQRQQVQPQVTVPNPDKKLGTDGTGSKEEKKVQEIYDQKPVTNVQNSQATNARDGMGVENKPKEQILMNTSNNKMGQPSAGASAIQDINAQKVNQQRESQPQAQGNMEQDRQKQQVQAAVLNQENKPKTDASGFKEERKVQENFEQKPASNMSASQPSNIRDIPVTETKPKEQTFEQKPASNMSVSQPSNIRDVPIAETKPKEQTFEQKPASNMPVSQPSNIRDIPVTETKPKEQTISNVTNVKENPSNFRGNNAQEMNGSRGVNQLNQQIQQNQQNQQNLQSLQNLQNQQYQQNQQNQQRDVQQIQKNTEQDRQMQQVQTVIPTKESQVTGENDRQKQQIQAVVPNQGTVNKGGNAQENNGQPQNTQNSQLAQQREDQTQKQASVNVVNQDNSKIATNNVVQKDEKVIKENSERNTEINFKNIQNTSTKDMIAENKGNSSQIQAPFANGQLQNALKNDAVTNNNTRDAKEEKSIAERNYQSTVDNKPKEQSTSTYASLPARDHTKVPDTIASGNNQSMPKNERNSSGPIKTEQEEYTSKYRDARPIIETKQSFGNDALKDRQKTDPQSAYQSAKTLERTTTGNGNDNGSGQTLPYRESKMIIEKPTNDRSQEELPASGQGRLNESSVKVPFGMTRTQDPIKKEISDTTINDYLSRYPASQEEKPSINRDLSLASGHTNEPKSFPKEVNAPKPQADEYYPVITSDLFHQGANKEIKPEPPKREPSPIRRLRKKNDVEEHIRQHKIVEIRKLKKNLEGKLTALDEQLFELEQAEELEFYLSPRKDVLMDRYRREKLEEMEKKKKAQEFAKRMQEQKRAIETQRQKRRDQQEQVLLKELNMIHQRQVDELELMRNNQSGKTKMEKELQKVKEKHNNAQGEYFSMLEERKKELKEKRDFSVGENAADRSYITNQGDEEQGRRAKSRPGRKQVTYKSPVLNSVLRRDEEAKWVDYEKQKKRRDLHERQIEYAKDIKANFLPKVRGNRLFEYEKKIYGGYNAQNIENHMQGYIAQTNAKKVVDPIGRYHSKITNESFSREPPEQEMNIDTNYSKEAAAKTRHYSHHEYDSAGDGQSRYATGRERNKSVQPRVKRGLTDGKSEYARVTDRSMMAGGRNQNMSMDRGYYEEENMGLKHQLENDQLVLKDKISHMLSDIKKMEVQIKHKEELLMRDIDKNRHFEEY